MKFNERLQITELGLGSGEQTISFSGLTNPFVQTYKYDSLYRLTEAKETTGSNTNWTQNFTYDRFGNRLTFAQNIGGITNNQTPTIDANTNRFTSQIYGYDKNGNITTDAIGNQVRAFTFNGENKQTEVKKDNVTIGKYFYDGEGKRVKKVTDLETTIFVYSGGKLIAEYSTKLADTPAVNYTTSDHLGSPRAITNEFGQVKSRRDFMPFGEDLYAGIGGRSNNSAQRYSSNEDEVRQKFTGYQKDGETSLDFAEARMYNNSHGRFTAVDPLLASGKSANPQTFNRYTYVLNNPLVLVDKNGEFPIYFYLRSFAPYKWFGPGSIFKGDNRGFSTSIDRDTTSRVQAYTEIETDIDKYWNLNTTRYATFSSQSRYSTYTTAIGSLSEADYGFYSPEPTFSEAYIGDELGNHRSNGLKGSTNSLGYNLYGNNDAFPVGIRDYNLSSDIDLRTDIEFNIESGKNGLYINFTGTIRGDQFPAAEAFVRDAQGNAVMLGVFSIPSGADPLLNLPFNFQRPMMNINVTILANDDGIFQGVMENGNLISMEEWKKRFTNQSATP